MINLVLVKKGMLRYIQDVKAVRGMGQDLSDLHVLLCKVRLVGAWIKRRVVVVGLGGLEARNRGNINTEMDMLGLLRRKEYNGMEIIM